jgi:hypothetical protein
MLLTQAATICRLQFNHIVYCAIKTERGFKKDENNAKSYHESRARADHSGKFYFAVQCRTGEADAPARRLRDNQRRARIDAADMAALAGDFPFICHVDVSVVGDALGGKLPRPVLGGSLHLPCDEFFLFWQLDHEIPVRSRRPAVGGAAFVAEDDELSMEDARGGVGGGGVDVSVALRSHPTIIP